MKSSSRTSSEQLGTISHFFFFFSKLKFVFLRFKLSAFSQTLRVIAVALSKVSLLLFEFVFFLKKKIHFFFCLNFITTSCTSIMIRLWTAIFIACCPKTPIRLFSTTLTKYFFFFRFFFFCNTNAKSDDETIKAAKRTANAFAFLSSEFTKRFEKTKH
jgi:hypothetical protein